MKANQYGDTLILVEERGNCDADCEYCGYDLYPGDKRFWYSDPDTMDPVYGPYCSTYCAEKDRK